MTDNTNGQQPADQPADQPAASPVDGAVSNDGQAAAREDANATAEQTQAPEDQAPAAQTPAAQPPAAQPEAAQPPVTPAPAAQTPAESTSATPVAPVPVAPAAAPTHENTTEVLSHELPNGQPTASYGQPQQPTTQSQSSYQQPGQPPVQPPYGGYQAPGQGEAPRFYPPSQPGAQQPGAQPTGAYQPGQYAQQPAQPQQGQPQQPQQHAPHYAGAAQQGVPAAFGGPNQAQSPQGPQGPQNPYAQQPSQTPPAPAKSKSNRGLAGMIAMLAVGALIGGASGAGATLWVTSATKSNVSDSQSGSKSFTINDTNNVNLTTAIAATAGPSVVTIAVQSGQSAGTGSGIVLSEDGYILTNTHVVTLDGQIADPTIQVTDANGKIYQAKIVGTDPIYDLAVIKLQDASGLTPMEFANSDKLNVGDTAVAIGAPLGLSGTVTDGIVSALNRSISVASSAVPDTKSQDGQSGGNDGQNPFDMWNFDVPGQNQQQQQSQNNGSISIAVIQTDAAINPGNSGGALLDDKGKLIGVNVAIASAGSSSSGSSQGGSIGVGFAIPSNIAKRVADEIIKDGKATHGLLGATVKDSSSDPSAKVAGALIDKPTANGAAEAAGLQSGDIVTEFNGVPIHGANDLTAQVRALAGGATAKLTFVRGGETKTVDVTLGTLQV